MAQQDITGLLTGMFSGDPAALNQKLLAQKAVASNPNLLATTQTQIGNAPEQLARMRQSVGGMFGQDLRSSGQKVQEQLKGLDVRTPAGQQQAVELIKKIAPEKALALQTMFQQENAQLLKTKQDTSNADRKALLEQQKADTQQQTVDAQLASAQAAKKETIKIERYDPVTASNITEYVLKNDPTKVIASYPSPLDAQKISVQTEKALGVSNEEARKYGNMAAKAERTAIALETAQPTGGVIGDFENYVKDVTGTQDAASEARTLVTNLRNGNAINNLPKGPASDKDIALVLAGEPPENANADYLARYARGIVKLARREEQYFRDQSRWMDNNKSIVGFQTSQNIKRNEETLAAMNPQILAALRNSYGTSAEEGNQLFFEDKYGFNLKALDQELEADRNALNKN